MPGLATVPKEDAGRAGQTPTSFLQQLSRLRRAHAELIDAQPTAEPETVSQERLQALLEAYDHVCEAMRRSRVVYILQRPGGTPPTDDVAHLKIHPGDYRKAELLTTQVSETLRRLPATVANQARRTGPYRYFLDALAREAVGPNPAKDHTALRASQADWARLYTEARQRALSTLSTRQDAEDTLRMVAGHALNGIMRLRLATTRNTLLADALDAEATPVNVVTSMLDALAAGNHLLVKSLTPIHGHTADTEPYARIRYEPDQARELVVAGLRRWSNEMATTAQAAFQEGRVDLFAPAVPSEPVGMCCLISEGRSIIKVAYDGSLDALFVLAHELGHAYHYWLTPHDSYVARLVPTCIAEVAAAVAENALHEELRRHLGRDTMAAIWARRVVTNLVRTRCFHAFETRVGQAVKASGVMDPDTLDRLLARCLSDTYAGIAHDRPTASDWIWRRHLYGRPFADWQYAFGFLVASELKDLRAADDSLVDIYQAALARSGTQPTAQTLAECGLRIDTSTFWDSAVARAYVRSDLPGGLP